jgi:hypothetical protein
MGGNIDQATGFSFEQYDFPDNRVELGKGCFGYTIKAPNGETIVVEEISGAIVGNNLEEVKQDIEHADEKVIRNQIESACKENVRIVSQEEFWKIYCKRRIV